jgi:hypothetical protein
MTDMCNIGPVEISGAHLAEDNTHNVSGEDSWRVFCEQYKAKQLMGLVEENGEITRDSSGNLTVISGVGGWGPIWIDTSTPLGDNNYLQHKGYHALRSVEPDTGFGTNVNYSYVNVAADLITEDSSPYLYMAYTPGVSDGTTLDMEYEESVAATDYHLQEPFDTWDTTNVWLGEQDNWMGSHTVTPIASKLNFIGSAATDGVFGGFLTETRSTFQTPWTSEFDLTWVAQPAGYPHGLIWTVTDGNGHNYSNLVVIASNTNWFRIILVVYSSYVAFYIQKCIYGTVTTLSGPHYLTGSQTSPKFKVNYYEDGTAEFYVDKDWTSGTPSYSKYWGRADLGMPPGFLQSGACSFAMENRSSTSATTKVNELDIYTTYTGSGAIDCPNVVFLPATATPTTSADFTRVTDEGGVSCYEDPGDDLLFTIDPYNLYEGSVKLFSNNHSASPTYRQVTGTNMRLTPETTYVTNGLLKLVPYSNAVKLYFYSSPSWIEMTDIGVQGDIERFEALEVNPERVQLAINETEWTLERGRQWCRVKHPLALTYSLMDMYYHDGTPLVTPASNTALSMTTDFYSSMYYTNLFPPNVSNCGDTLNTTEGFSAYNNATLSVATTPVKSGTKSIKMNIPNTAYWHGAQTLTRAVSGQQYIFGGWINAPSGVTCVSEINSIGGSNYTAKYVIGTGSYVPTSVTVTADSDTIACYFLAKGDNVDVYFDQLQLEEGTNTSTWDVGKGFENRRMQIIKTTPTNLFTNSIPASDYTGIGWYDASIASASPNSYLFNAKEFFVQTEQSLGVWR